jgi:hypothetical protein
MPTGSFFIVNLTLKHEPITGIGTPHFFYYTTKYKPFCQKNRKTDQTGTESVNPPTKQQAQPGKQKWQNQASKYTQSTTSHGTLNYLKTE